MSDDVKRYGKPEEKGGKEARGDNSRFKPIGRNLKQGTLLLFWERKFLREEKVRSVIRS